MFLVDGLNTFIFCLFYDGLMTYSTKKKPLLPQGTLVFKIRVFSLKSCPSGLEQHACETRNFSTKKRRPRIVSRTFTVSVLQETALLR